MLVLLELALRMAGVGEVAAGYDPLSGFSAATPLLEPFEREDGVRIYRVSEARLGRPARTDADARQRAFLAEKPRGGFRIFVVGGSTAAGVPYGPALAFSGWLERRLSWALPDVPIEVVNAAVSGYGSRRVLQAVREIATHEPDLLVLYSGHNEWIEQLDYGRLLHLSPWRRRLLEHLASTRLFRLVSRVRRERRETPAGALARFERSERDRFLHAFAVAANRIQAEQYPSEAELQDRERWYRDNVEEMVAIMQRAGGRMMILTLSQDFRDWPPGASSHPADLSQLDRQRFDALLAQAEPSGRSRDCATALRLYEQALAIDAGFAELHYRIAQCREATGDFAAARQAYRLASDLDRVPHGAPTRYNDFLRSLARGEQLLLVDVDALLESEAPNALVGRELMVDFAHPNLGAHQRMAEALAEALRAADLPRPASQWRSEPFVAPAPADLLEAQPELLREERTALLFACLMARRRDCAAQQARLILEVDPDLGWARVIAQGASSDAGAEEDAR